MNNNDSTRRRFSLNKKGWIAGIGVTSAAVVMAGAGAAVAATSSPSASSGSTTAVTAATATPDPTNSFAGGGQPRSAPADGGATGTITSTSASGFTLTTWTGVNVAVDETSSTKITGGSKADVQDGESVLVLGLVNVGTSNAVITAAHVELQPKGDGGAATGQADGVEPSVKGEAGPTKSVGTIPASYTQGTGTIVSGEQAYKAVEAAQAVYPGGIVDRVVELSDGSYEVHNMAIAWPHHVFETHNDKVIGAND